MKRHILAALALAALLSPLPYAEATGKTATTKPAQGKAHAAKPAAKPKDKPKEKPKEKPADAKPAQESAAKPANEPAPPETPARTRAEAIKRAEAFLNASPVMIADFTQVGGDGRRAEGKLYVQKAGRMRFEYAAPATLEIVADGANVAIRDRKLNTQDLYFIDQTPLKFLLNEKTNLEKDFTVTDVVFEETGTKIFIEDRTTFGGTSRLELIFDPRSFALKQWRVTDPQGYETLVSLFNIERSRSPDPALFKIEQSGALFRN